MRESPKMMITDKMINRYMLIVKLVMLGFVLIAYTQWSTQWSVNADVVPDESNVTMPEPVDIGRTMFVELCNVAEEDRICVHSDVNVADGHPLVYPSREDLGRPVGELLPMCPTEMSPGPCLWIAHNGIGKSFVRYSPNS